MREWNWEFTEAMRKSHALRSALIFLLLFVQSQAPAWSYKFVKVEPIDGIWWFVDAHGKPFLSRGVDAVSFNDDYIAESHTCPYAEANRTRYKTIERWRTEAASRLIDLNFNTLGAWSDSAVAQESIKKKHLLYTAVLNFYDHYKDWGYAGVPDYFDPKFSENVDRLAEKICLPLQNDERLIGYFADSFNDWTKLSQTLLLQYLNAPQKSPGREAALAYLERHYKNFAGFNRIWQTDFSSWGELEAHTAEFRVHIADKDLQANYVKDCDLFAGLAASRYFEIIDQAIKKSDPNHLNLGCSFSEYPGPEILRSCAAHVDVISFNCYQADPEKLITKFEKSGKPLLISEFTFRGKDSGLPNSKGKGPLVENQRSRADRFTSFIKKVCESPNIVGYYWFKYVDQPKEGRFDGENSNCGISNIEDEPYDDLVRAMKEVNLKSQSLHRPAAKDLAY
jgi:agarase